MSSEPARLPEGVARLVLDEANECLLSAISVFEIVQKVSTGKLNMGTTVAQLLDLARTNIGLAELPLRTEHSLRVEQLPWHHRDPFDRILIAQALSEDIAVVTSDRRFAAYGVDVRW